MLHFEQGWEFAHSLIFGEQPEQIAHGCSFLVSDLSDLLTSLIFSRFGNLLICSFAQIAQIKWATVSDLLRSLKTNERLWANGSGRSCQKSDWEWIAQVAHDKWSTVSNSLRLIHDNWVNEQIAYFFWANCLFALFSLLLSKNEQFAKKIWLKSYFFVCFFLNEQFNQSLFFNEWCEQIAQVTHQKWAMWANCTRRSPKMSVHERYAQVAHQKWATLSKSLRRSPKMSEWLNHSFFCAIRTKSKERISNSAYNEDFFISFLFLKVAHKTKFVLELVKKQS